VHQEEKTDERDDDAFFEQLFSQGADRFVNEIASVIDRGDDDAGRKTSFYIFELFLDSANGR
jgi:hypothetical protein